MSEVNKRISPNKVNKICCTIIWQVRVHNLKKKIYLSFQIQSRMGFQKMYESDIRILQKDEDCTGERPVGAHHKSVSEFSHDPVVLFRI